MSPYSNLRFLVRKLSRYADFKDSLAKQTEAYAGAYFPEKELRSREERSLQLSRSSGQSASSVFFISRMLPPPSSSRLTMAI